MSSTLYRLGLRMSRSGWKVIGIWVLLLGAFAGLAVGLGGKLNDQFSIPGTEAQRGLDILADRFPQMSGVGGTVIFESTDGRPIQDHEQQIVQVMQKAAKLDHVAAAPNPFAKTSPGQVSKDRTTMLGNVQMDADLGALPKDAVDSLVHLTETSSGDGLHVQLGGQVLQSTSVPVGITEVLGVVAALVILAIAFRSVITAFVPIVTAMVGVGTAMLLMYAAASVVDISTTAPTLAVMLGLAVGIDYALFLIARHLDQIRHGMDVNESIARSVATSGSAVIFAGMTVIIALVGLFITQIPFLAVMGVVSAVAVAAAVLLTLTLLPAILGLLGERLRGRKGRAAVAAQQAASEHTAVEEGTEADQRPAETAPDKARPASGGREPLRTKWARMVTKVPLLTVVIVVAALGAATIPAKDLALALPDLGTESTDSLARQSYDKISQKFGPGHNAPILVLADIVNSNDPLTVMSNLKTEIAGLEDVDEVPLATPNENADLGLVMLLPKGSQSDKSTAELVQRLRDHASEWEQKYKISDVTVTGSTAAAVDITDRLSGALVPFGLFVVGLSLVLLAIVFRSIWVPLKASIGFLLSVGAAFGVTSMVFTYGWGASLLNVHVTGPVISFFPIILMGVLFGLAMDYEVFLVSRMREEFVHTGDASESIISGFTKSSPVVTAAALIMFLIFFAFIPESGFMIQPISLGLAVGVFVDAFIVRMTLVPAVLALLGRHAWQFPKVLDRVLPHMDVEGEGLGTLLEHQRWTEEHGQAAVRFHDVVTPTLDGTDELGPFEGSIPPGSLLLATSADPARLRSFAYLSAGRIIPVEGTVFVAGRLIPDEVGAAQRHVDLVEDLDDTPKRGAKDRVEVHLSLRPLLDREGAVRALEERITQGSAVVVAAYMDPDLLLERLDDASMATVFDLDRASEHPLPSDLLDQPTDESQKVLS